MADVQGIYETLGWILSLLPEGDQECFKSGLKEIEKLESSGVKKEIINFVTTAEDLYNSKTDDPQSLLKKGASLAGCAFTILKEVGAANPAAAVVFTAVTAGLTLLNTKEEPTIEEVLNNLLEEKCEEDLIKESEGSKEAFINSAKFLCGVGNRKLQKHEVSTVAACVPIYGGVKLFGKLRKIITDLRHEQSENYFESKKKLKFSKLMRYVDIYCCLSTLRYAVLLHLYSVLCTSENCPAVIEGVKSVIEDQWEKDKNLLNFFVFPDRQTAIVCFLYESSKWDRVACFLAARQMHLDNLEFLCEETYHIKPVSHPNSYMYMANVPGSWLRWSNTMDISQAKFKFEKIGDKPPYGFIIKSNKWNEYHVRMGKGAIWAKGVDGEPDNNAIFNIVPIENSKDCSPKQKFILSPRAMNTTFLYWNMSGRINGNKCKPMENTIWIIEKAG